MEFVVDWNSVCLVCLQEGEMRSIYEKDDKDVTLSEKIMHCSSIEIKQGMSLPEQICTNCYDDLLAAYRFRTNCESTNIILKSFVNSNVTDLEIPSENGQTYKYKLPLGLNVKRIKVKPKEQPPVIKMEKIDEEIEQAHDMHDHFETEQYIVAEPDCRFDDGDDDDNHDYDEDDEPLSQLKKKAMYHDQDEHEYETLDDNIEEILGNVNSPQEMVNLKIEKGLEDNCEKDDAPPTRRKGRPRKPNRNDVRYSGDAKDLVDNLTTVTYVRKIAREDGKPMKICDVCGNTYKYQHALESHMRRHRNEKPFSCEFCDRAFVANVELRRHMRVHTGQKPYPCRYCNRRFSDFGSRIKHERTHTGERPYECVTCGKAFAYAHVLSVHLLTHTGEKKFKCQECGKGFTKKVYLIGHMKRHNDMVQGTMPVSNPSVNKAGAESGIQSEIIYINPKVEATEVEMYYES